MLATELFRDINRAILEDEHQANFYKGHQLFITLAKVVGPNYVAYVIAPDLGIMESFEFLTNSAWLLDSGFHRIMETNVAGAVGRVQERIDLL
jgi:hypothetical protein